MNDHPQPIPQSPSSVPRPKPWKAILIAVALLGIVAALLWFWRSSRGQAWGYVPPAAIDVVATELKAEPVPVTLEALGELRAFRQVTLSSEVAGRVAGIAFESGQTVKENTLLIQLDDSVEQADLVAAKANAAFAEQQWTRANELIATGAVSTEVLQQRKAEHDQATAQVLQLTARIRQKRILAPFSGELGVRWVDLGQYLNPGDRTVTLTDLDTLYVNFDVPQQELLRLQVGQPVEVRSDAPGAEPQQATINAIEPQVGRDTRNVTVQALLPNTQRTLRPGMYVTASVALGAESGALVLPYTAIATSASGNAAVVIRDLSPEKTGKADIVPVTVGRRLGDRVLVTRGLQAGDVVVTEGQLRIQPGATVRIVEKPAAGGTAGR